MLDGLGQVWWSWMSLCKYLVCCFSETSYVHWFHRVDGSMNQLLVHWGQVQWLVVVYMCRFSETLLRHWSHVLLLVQVKYDGSWVWICARSLKHYFHIGLLWLVVHAMNSLYIGSIRSSWWLCEYKPPLWNIVSNYWSHMVGGWLRSSTVVPGCVR